MLGMRVGPVVAASGVDADRALIDHADGSVAIVLDLVQPIQTPWRLTHGRGNGGRNPDRRQIEEACLPEIIAGRDDPAGEALGFCIRGAFNRTRLPWLV